MDHQAMADFLERLKKSLHDAFLVRAQFFRNDHGAVATDTPITGNVESLKHGQGGSTTIEVSCWLGVIPWTFSSRTPALERVSQNSYKLYNGPSWLLLEFVTK